MKKFRSIMAIVLVAIFVLGMTACGSSEPTDPNAGLYVAATAEAFGIEIEVASIFAGGFNIELKDNGKCKMEVDGQTANGKWTLDGTAFTVSGGGIDCAGTLSNGEMILENVLDSGVNMTFIRE